MSSFQFDFKLENFVIFKKLVYKGISRPHRLPIYIKYLLTQNVPFNYESVTGGWGEHGAGLPQFSARLFNEVQLLKDVLKNSFYRKSLELGCGYGRLTPWIAQYSKLHYAIEPEVKLLNASKQLYPSVKFYRAQVQQMPFPKNYFDLCVSWTVLQHIPPNNLSKVAMEMKRVCKSTATIILAEGVGKGREIWYWEHSLEDWKKLFSPWKLTLYTEKPLEERDKGLIRSVMRFDCANSED